MGALSRSKPLQPPLLLLLLLVLSCFLETPITAYAKKKSYVVYLGEHDHPDGSNERSDLLIRDEKVTDSHHQFLGSILGSKEKAGAAIFYSYTRHINGFAANLEEEEAIEIATYPEVISVFPNEGRKLHTTRSWSFLGLERDGRVPLDSLWTKARYGEDVIIANLDTGVWPESESFNDVGMGPIPSKWRGTCQSGVGDDFHCNRKLIGARYFNKGFVSSVNTTLNSTYYTPRDTEGHGTHTLSTAGGGFVAGANVFGFGNGTAKGGSPKARVAAYRVCFPPVNKSQCFDADILSAFDAAISDGVDVLSVSLGGSPAKYFMDSIAIGSFHAVKKGITVVCSAGNSGPKPSTVSNLAPWIITVAASTMDREFPAYASLGNGKKLKGQSLSPRRIHPVNKLYPLISSAAAKSKNATTHDAQRCFKKSLDPKKVKGMIVACLRGTNARVQKGDTVNKAGGLGMILANDVKTGNEVIADAHVLPATHVSYSEGLSLFSYINSTKSPMAYISAPTTMLDTKLAPFMAAFSSQGPNVINPEFLKPDITAPGVSIIAAFTAAEGPTNLEFDTRRVKFNSISGTSMSCPHIAGVVGLLKSMHPDWSPSAIKSAIMTTARSRDNTESPMKNSSFVEANAFNYGSGHIRPNWAMDPGLVYDVTLEDYMNFLCTLRYNSSTISKFSKSKSYSCPKKRQKLVDFNYPSITIPKLSDHITITRRLKNVGTPGTYTVRVDPPVGVSVTVNPISLEFVDVGEEKEFSVKFEWKNVSNGEDYVFGRLIWSDGVHYVRSPLVIKQVK